jgi:ABC-2 type transport system ATP-binding protein
MSEPVLRCRDLSKHYAFPVLNHLNLDLPSGRIIGLLGPNGCGKSTLMKLISGLLVPSGGEIFLCGEPRSERTNAYISYLPERTYFSGGMQVNELIAYFADFYADFDASLARAMMIDLGISLTARLRTLSKGTKEKVQLILVMARRARLYLLDEPIAGVDPAARDYVLKTIIGSRNPEASILITTHLIYDIEPILDDFLFMGQGGQILLSGNADEVRQEHGKTLDQLFKEVFSCSGRP